MSIKHLTPRHINKRKIIERRLFILVFNEFCKGIPIEDSVEILKDYATNLSIEKMKEEVERNLALNRKWRQEIHERIKNSEITYEI